MIVFIRVLVSTVVGLLGAISVAWSLLEGFSTDLLVFSLIFASWLIELAYTAYFKRTRLFQKIAQRIGRRPSWASWFWRDNPGPSSLWIALSLVLFALFVAAWMVREATTLKLMLLWTTVYATGQLVLSLIHPGRLTERNSKN